MMKRGMAVLLIVVLLVGGCAQKLSVNGHAVQADLKNLIGTGPEADGAGKVPTNYYKASAVESSR